MKVITVGNSYVYDGETIEEIRYWNVFDSSINRLKLSLITGITDNYKGIYIYE